MNADWPGNIRELENFLERCVILTQGDELNVPRRRDLGPICRPVLWFRQGRPSSKPNGRRSSML